jgi:hypothetical protein
VLLVNNYIAGSDRYYLRDYDGYVGPVGETYFQVIEIVNKFPVIPRIL